MDAGPVVTQIRKGVVALKKHVTVYRETGRYGGWPANNGIWNWGNEILVGFSVGYMNTDMAVTSHPIDRTRPYEVTFARSLDGGETWRVETPDLSGAKPAPLSAPIHFAHPDFALRLAGSDFNYSYDRGKTWSAPVTIPDFGKYTYHIRTCYHVLSNDTCLCMLTALKPDGKEGHVFAALMKNGGLEWEELGACGETHRGFTIMPSSVILDDGRLLVISRSVIRAEQQYWLEAQISSDMGRSFSLYNIPVKNTGYAGNPAALVKLPDGRLSMTYGFRDEPFTIRTHIGSPDSIKWSRAVFLRGGTDTWDIGYVRAVLRPDGKVVAVYYYADNKLSERYIAATIFDPSEELEIALSEPEKSYQM